VLLGDASSRDGTGRLDQPIVGGADPALSCLGAMSLPAERRRVTMGFLSRPVRTVRVPEPSSEPLPALPEPPREREPAPARRREERPATPA
jgi:hypothetical protein